LPPLRERREDIPLLVERFIVEFSNAYGVEPKRVTPEAMTRIIQYAWPGNIRELQNAIERAFALSSEPEITLKDLPPAALRGEEEAAESGTVTSLLPLEEVERRSIMAALQRSGGNKNEAARLLGIDRQRLYRKIEKYGLVS
jgi:DNA-binding NtrC family response regulator